MRFDVTLPWWSYAVMGVGLAVFVFLVGMSIRRNRGMKRSLFATPYTLWMILFTIVPIILVAYYAFTNSEGAFTLDNFRHFILLRSIVRSVVNYVILPVVFMAIVMFKPNFLIELFFPRL